MMTATKFEIWANACYLGSSDGYATYRGTYEQMPDCDVKVDLKLLPSNCDVAMRYGPNGWQDASIPCSSVYRTLYFPSDAAREKYVAELLAVAK